MREHLLLISLGPVQDFIAQAKRTRDLWMGSHLISEISKAAAKDLAQKGANLIFPALKQGDPRLEPSNNPFDKDAKPVFNVANKLVAIVSGHPQTFAASAQDAANKRLVDWGLLVWDQQLPLVDPDPKNRDAAQEQLSTFLEFLAVWAPVESKSYADIRKELEAELQARKSLRPFTPWSHQRGGIYKSSLDGARESVLKDPKERTHTKFTRYRIGNQEQLDAIGLLKRAGGEPGQFVPVPTIGLMRWIEAASTHASTPMKELEELCHQCKFQEVDDRLKWVERFPYDGQLFLEDRLQPYCKEYGVDANKQKALSRTLNKIRKELSEPHPFIACLVADGDNMGKLINEYAEEGYQKHQELSEKLAAFAQQARTIVEENNGNLVYAGGDDVLALINVQDALPCAFKLQHQFKQQIGRSLSVGLGIGGVIESLGDLFEFGRTAEHEAKQKRNALALLVQKRGGSQRVWCSLWDDNPHQRLQDDIGLLKRRCLSAKKIYQLGDMLRKMPKPSEKASEDWISLLRQETQRILSRNEQGGDALKDKQLFPNLEIDNYQDQYLHIQGWIERLEIALFLAGAEPSLKTPKAAL